MQTQPDLSTALDRIDDTIAGIMQDFELPGAALSIVRGTQQVVAKGFGVRSIVTQAPVSPTSLFHMASISKTFVSTALVQLFEQGKLDLNAPVVAYLPYFRIDDDRYASITVQQMMSHISGMPDLDDYHWGEPEVDDGALERYVRSLGKEKLIGPPGEQYSYSNMAYEVLGDVVAKVSGQTFEAYMAEHILKPLGMEHSTYLKALAPPELATSPHINTPHSVPSPIYPYNRAHAPSSTLHSNAVDMGRWMIANLNQGQLGDACLLQPASYALLWHPYHEIHIPGNSVGLSWFIGEHRGQRMVSHAGGDVGYRSQMALLPELGWGVTLMMNTIPAPAREMAIAVIDHLLGFEPEIPKPQAMMAVIRAWQDQGEAAALEIYRRLQADQVDGVELNHEPFIETAFLLGESLQASRAVDLLKFGLQVTPEVDALYAVLGWAYLQMGERELALENLKKCLEMAPANSWAKKLVDRILNT